MVSSDNWLGYYNNNDAIRIEWKVLQVNDVDYFVEVFLVPIARPDRAFAAFSYRLHFLVYDTLYIKKTKSRKF